MTKATNSNAARHVAFDWGGVFTIGTFDGRSTERLAKQYALDVDVVRTHYFALIHHLEVGEWTLPAFWEEFAERLQIGAVPYEDFRDLYLGSVVRNEAMYRALAQLPGSVRVGLLSNNYPVVSDVLRQDPEFGRFDALVFSNEIGHKKPSAKAFQALVDALNVLPETCAFVDDVPENIAAAQAHGFHGLLYDHTRHAEFLSDLQGWLRVPLTDVERV
ncbi:HAD family hydrolase [Deinococcus peraridilitoris]|uniref:Haloacid dehalogenase superfamily protein, subfamily IA, variant 3 with third motif having DD or ED n=1 Tax=Deinococcus peraridilitoris (strain DSM 19664 / LMG 22246 / CIP 109416 / KR-200) TaxID=937777 RepID=L0A4U7_DEIPD|nr:HAD family phosphatase [Deinococcus peraridilitoris]AFZ68908.1 haloacid dehalogenase superfamily protein, subfamily IA, variant 3 with third motif having DD or ED [Deinococcus peraridilitoris DSM 19664]